MTDKKSDGLIFWFSALNLYQTDTAFSIGKMLHNSFFVRVIFVLLLMFTK